jgi:hypothetical protein
MQMDLKMLIDERNRLEKQLKTIDKCIENLQEICDHSWVRLGNDSHHDYEQCNLCKLERKI